LSHDPAGMSIGSMVATNRGTFLNASVQSYVPLFDPSFAS